MTANGRSEAEGRPAHSADGICRNCGLRISVVDGWWKHAETPEWHAQRACYPDAQGKRRYIYAEPAEMVVCGYVLTEGPDTCCWDQVHPASYVVAVQYETGLIVEHTVCAFCAGQADAGVLPEQHADANVVAVSRLTTPKQQHHDGSACFDQACHFDHPEGGPFPHPCDIKGADA